MTHSRLAVDVPSAWVVEDWQPTCGVATPTVYLGPQGLAQRCTTKARGVEVDLGHSVYTGTNAAARVRVPRTINGLHALVTTVKSPVDGGTWTEIWVTVTTRSLTIYVAAGDNAAMPGGAPGLAEQIVATIHGAPKGQ